MQAKCKKSEVNALGMQTLKMHNVNHINKKYKCKKCDDHA